MLLLTNNFPLNVFTGFAKSQGIVSVNDFWFLIWLQEHLQALMLLPENFLFYMGMIVSTVLPSFVPLHRIDDCFELHIIQSKLL